MAYIESKNIKVYPTANRKQPLDPESIYRSEANSVLANKLLSPNKVGSYVITETYDSMKPLEFVLGGYYFKIKDPSVITIAGNNEYYAGIVVDYRSAEQSEEADTDNIEFSSKVLKNLEGIIFDVNTTNNCLDDDTNSFTGLYIYSEVTTGIDISKFTHTLKLLVKGSDTNVYFIPEESKFAIDTRLVKDFNNPQYFLSDYFVSNEFNSPVKIKSNDIEAVTNLTTNKITFNKNLFLNDTSGDSDININANGGKTIRLGKQNGTITENHVDMSYLHSTKASFGQFYASQASEDLHKTSNYTYFNRTLFKPSAYYLNDRGKINKLWESGHSVDDSLNQELIIYSNNHAPMIGSSYHIDNPTIDEWEPTQYFSEALVEVHPGVTPPRTSRNRIVERIRFGGLSTKINSYPFIGINSLGNSFNERITKRTLKYGYTELGGTPIKSGLSIIDSSQKELNSTRYVRSTKCASAKLTSDGLVLHVQPIASPCSCTRWDNTGTFNFGTVVASNINSFIYMNNVGVKADVSPIRSGESSPSYADERYKFGARFESGAGLVIGTGSVYAKYDGLNLPSDCRSTGDIWQCPTPIPIVISNGIDPSNANRDSDLVGVNTRVLLDSEGNSYLNIQVPSDERLKYNIHNYYPINSILDVPVKQFTYKQNDKTDIGFIAQDLQKYFPELVSEDDQGYLSISESKIVYLLLDEVKKLRKEVDELKK